MDETTEPQHGAQVDAIRAVPAARIVRRELSRLAAAAEEIAPQRPRLGTGLRDLDAVLGGLRRGELIVIAGRPSMGSTTLALGMARAAALRANRPAAIYSLDLDAEEVVVRMLAPEGLVDSERVRRGRLGADDWRRTCRAADRLAVAPLMIDDSPDLTIDDLASDARAAVTGRGVELVVVDDLQRIAANRDRGDGGGRHGVGAAVARLRRLARELDVALVVTCQVARAAERRRDKRPRLGDLKGSEAIEEEADVVLLLYRDEVYDPEGTEERGLARIEVAKNRRGPTDWVKVVVRSMFAMLDDICRE